MELNDKGQHILMLVLEGVPPDWPMQPFLDIDTVQVGGETFKCKVVNPHQFSIEDLDTSITKLGCTAHVPKDLVLDCCDLCGETGDACMCTADMDDDSDYDGGYGSSDCPTCGLDDLWCACDE